MCLLKLYSYIPHSGLHCCIKKSCKAALVRITFCNDSDKEDGQTALLFHLQAHILKPNKIQLTYFHKCSFSDNKCEWMVVNKYHATQVLTNNSTK